MYVNKCSKKFNFVSFLRSHAIRKTFSGCIQEGPTKIQIFLVSIIQNYKASYCHRIMPDQFASLICSFIFFCSFRNAYNQRKLAMFVRQGEKYKEIFVQNPRTKKMECILSYPKEAWSSVWNRFYSQRS